MVSIENLPEATAIENLTFEGILQENITFLQKLLPSWSPVESDPWLILLEAMSYKELYNRMRDNEKIKKMLPHLSSGDDLDNFIFGFYGGLERLEDESDEEFLTRAMLSVNRFSTAGAKESYIYYTLLTDARIDDVMVRNALKPLETYVDMFLNKDAAAVLEALRVLIADFTTVEVYIASKLEIDEELITEVQNSLNEEKIRPLTDYVLVKEATHKNIVLDVTLELLDLSEQETIQSKIEESFDKFFKIGEDLIYSDIISKLHTDGVYKVNVNISDDIEIKETEIAKLSLNLSFIEVEKR